MKAFLYSTILTWKMNLRNKDTLIMYYIVPLVFYLFMGGIFTSIMPEMKQSLIQAMSVFGISMGAYLGGPMGPAQVFGTEIRKAYKVGKIPGWTEVAVNVLSGTIHLFLMQLLILLTAPIAFDSVRPDGIGIYLSGMLFFIITCMLVGTMLGLLVQKQSVLTMCSQLLFLPSIMLSGVMFPAEMMPEMLQKISYIFPATWGFHILMDAGERIRAYGILGAIALGCIGVSIFQLRRLEVQ